MDQGARACEALDQALVEAELIKSGGNIKQAAKALGVPRGDLGAHVRAVPALLDVALEIEEQRLDAAEAVIRRAIRRGRLADRMIAAHAFLAMTGKVR